MSFTTLISASDLDRHLGREDWVLFDCRFSLQHPEGGRQAYASGHLPGAWYAHLDEDLSGPIIPGTTGRHPLPDADLFGTWLSERGVGEGVQVVAYDDGHGAIAARLWWMVRWLGHEAVAVLDGGWRAWAAAGYPVSESPPLAHPRPFIPHPDPTLLVDAAGVSQIREVQGYTLLDARAAARYLGEHEPIDPVAGHIPGATSAPFMDNLDAEGRFLPPKVLKERFEGVLQGKPPGRAVCYCGSGVTAAHNILAMAHAGLAGAKLYAGSWSHWITDPSRPVATGTSG